MRGERCDAMPVQNYVGYNMLRTQECKRLNGTDGHENVLQQR